jgi:hypothetical protein
MNHDITHCKNENCKDKYTCKRYLAYVELIQIKYRYPVSMFLKTCDTKCEDYIKNKNNEN